MATAMYTTKWLRVKRCEVVATTKAGGFGFLAGATIAADQIENEIIRIRQLTDDRPFGLNFDMFQRRPRPRNNMSPGHRVPGTTLSSTLPKGTGPSMPLALLALAVGAFGIGTTEFVMMGLLPDVASDLHISIPSAGHLVSAYALGVVIGAPLLAAVPVAFMASALMGALLERSVIRFLYGRPLETLLATWGISLVLMQSVRTLFGAQNVGVENPSWMSGSVVLMGNLTLPWNRIVIVLFAAAVVATVVIGKRLSQPTAPCPAPLPKGSTP